MWTEKCIEDRWGMPFWDLLRDIAAQGYSRNQAAQILGMGRDRMQKLVRRNPGRVNFAHRVTPPAPDCKAWIDRVEAEYGMPIDQFLRAEARAARVNQVSMQALAEELEVPAHRVRTLCQSLGIEWPRVKRPVSGSYLRRRLVWRGVDDTLEGHARRAGLNVTAVVTRARRDPELNPERLFAPIISRRRSQ